MNDHDEWVEVVKGLIFDHGMQFVLNFDYDDVLIARALMSLAQDFLEPDEDDDDV